MGGTGASERFVKISSGTGKGACEDNYQIIFHATELQGMCLEKIVYIAIKCRSNRPKAFFQNKSRGCVLGIS
jgi:hypothetical protein